MKKPTILIIDDETSNIQVIINILEKSGASYKILSAAGGRLGLEIAWQAKPDIIITDWQMPDLNGIDVIRQLKKGELTRDIPVIMATGVKMASRDLKFALDSGAFDFVRKPIDETELVARLNSALRFVKQYAEKAEAETALSNLKTETALAEVNAKKRELLDATLKLQHLIKMYEKFRTKLKSGDCDECKLCDFAERHIRQMLDYANKQVWNELEWHFERMNDDFFNKINTRYPTLTANERKLCAYLRLNLSTKDIAAITNQSVRSIEIARTRLRQKLGLKGSDEDLNNFLTGI
jgi:CheY-like chemotaxis protein/DNA-binding CsgD family transcriptional regulator